MDEAQLHNAIAIIGMAGRFPKARNIDEFWQNLQAGRECISFFSDEDVVASGTDPAFLNNPQFVKAFGVLDDIELFDAQFFGISPREARLLDPQHRLFLECAWEALEHAGYDSEQYPGRISVFAGTNTSTYLFRNLIPNNVFVFVTADRFEMALTNNKDVMPMRVSYQMNLKGASVNISTTCSTSLVAIHLACQSLLTYQCDMVLAGGSHVRVPQKEGYLFQEGMIWSPDGHVRTFDAKSRGVVTGNGAGVIVLKRLEDALADGDTIHAIIRGSASNNDGSTKIGYTAPSIDGQAEATAEAISMAGIDSETITYVEVHGTGTELGDPVEFASVSKAFQATAANPDNQPKNYCGIGSVKTNIGHLNHAAGVAGLLKTVLALKHKAIPPSLNFETPNPRIDFASSPFYVSTTLREWKTNGVPRRAGVNSFGVGGTNAHVVLEEAPELEPSDPSRPWQLLLLSTRTPTALETATTNLAQHLQQHPGLHLADVAYTLQIGRKPMSYRRMVVCQDTEDAASALTSLDPKRVFSGVHESDERPVVFMFSGQGSQYVTMGRDLYDAEPTFREQVDQCCDILKPHLGLDLRDLLYPDDSEAVASATQQLQQTTITQPALFVIEYALAQLWMSWGVRPQAMVGHSIGEYVAACLAGVFSLEEALALVALRGQMMQDMPPGDMVAVPLSAETVQSLLSSELSVAVINGPTTCVVAGSAKAVEALRQRLAQEDIKYQNLHTSHAFHSLMMEPLIEPFTEQVRQIHLQPPRIPYLSNVSGTWITAEEATDPGYWARHIRQTVRFADNLGELLHDPSRILLEVGPGRTLSTLVNLHPDRNREQVVLTSLRHPQEQQPDIPFILTALGKLWLAGATVDWTSLYTQERRSRVPLPTYPFERRRYWIGTPRHGTTPGATRRSLSFINELDQEEEPLSVTSTNVSTSVAPRNGQEEQIAAVWQKFLGLQHIGVHQNFFELGGSSFTAGQLVVELSQVLQTEISLQEFLKAPTVAELAERIEVVAPEDPSPVPTKNIERTHSLIKIKPGNDAITPLFLVHPIEGHVFFYQDLAQSLNSDRPVYAFQSPGLVDDTEPLSQIETMARHYLAALQAIQPYGPYLLGGASFGGLVAFEMAQQLRVLNQPVDLLFLIDTPAVKQPLLDLEDDAAILAFVGSHLLHLDNSAISVHELRTMPSDEQIPYLLQQVQNGQQQGFTVTQLHQLMRVIKAHRTAMMNYAPQPYAGRILFFRAQEPRPKEITVRPESFWTDLATGGIEIYPIPGNHFTMNYLPHVQTIAERLELSLKHIEVGVR